MGLSNYQLVLLDNLVYLDEVARATDKGTTIGKVVNNLLYKDGNSANGAGSGTIKTDCMNHYKDGESANCMTTEEEWMPEKRTEFCEPTILFPVRTPVLCTVYIHSGDEPRHAGLLGSRVPRQVGRDCTQLQA